ncbi:MAG: NAD(P)H-dependent oxidoreductase subunit E [Moorellales bacterium]
MAADKYNAIVDKAIEAHGGKANALIQVLLDIQRELEWLPQEVLERVSDKLQIPLSRVRHVATFYKAFQGTPKGRHEIRVCTGTACHALGASRLLEAVEAVTGLRPGETDLGSKFTVRAVNCPGCCGTGPVVEIDGKIYGKVTASDLVELLREYERE